MRLFCNFEGCGEGATARDTAKDALLLCQCPRGTQGFIVRHGDDPVDDVGVKDLRDEVGCPALDLVRREGLTGEQGSTFRFGCDDLDFRTSEFQNLTGAGECAARTPARHEMVNPLTSEITQDFRAGGAAMISGVGFVLELAREKPAVFLSKLFGLSDHTAAAFGGGREDHLGSECPHDLSALDRKGFDHHGHKRIAFGGADHGECDTGISRGRLDDGLARLQSAPTLGVFDDRDGQPIFDGMQGVERLAFDEHRHVWGRKAIDPNDRRVAYRAEYAVVDHDPNGLIARLRPPTPDRHMAITDAYVALSAQYPIKLGRFLRSSGLFRSGYRNSPLAGLLADLAALARKLRRGFPQSVDGALMLLPTEKSPNRRSLEGWFEAQHVRPSIAAELDDSALVKTFAQQGVGVFAAPLAIEREIVHAYGVQLIGKVEGLKARFYVLSTERRIKHPAVAIIREQAQARLFNRETA